jgi:hypothetical protein
MDEEIGLEDGADDDKILGSDPGISTAPIVEHPNNP